MSEQIIENKIKEMIDAFREDYNVLTEDEKSCEQKISTLNAPCQIHVISAPSKKFHILIKTQFGDIPDKSVKHTILSATDYVSELEKIHETMSQFEEHDHVSDIIIPEEFGSSAFSSLVSFGQEIQSGKRDDIASGMYNFGGMALLGEQLAVWNLYGNLESIDFVDEGKKIVKGYKSDCVRRHEEQQKPQQITQYNPNTKTGFGTYFYPPILIGKLTPSMKERIEGKEMELLKENTILDEFDKLTLIINRGGLIGLQTDDKKNADRIISTITATLLLLGIPLHAHKISELATLSFDIKTQKVTQSQWSQSSLRTQFFSYGTTFDLFTPPSLLRYQITINDTNLLLTEAKRIWKQKSLFDLLKLILGSFTYLDTEEYAQSFILSWTIIEKHLYELWNQKLESSKISNSRIRDLNRWDTFRIAEILHLDRTISDDEYFEIRSLRELRNDLFHEGQGVTKKQAERCYDVAYEIAKKKAEITKTVSFQKILSI